MSLKAAILGFLKLDPTTGYTLRQRFDGSVGSFWSVTQSQIYRELHSLEAEGLVRMHREPGEGKPDRKVYSATAQGSAYFETWLRAPLEPLQLRHPLLLKLVFASEVPPKELDALLDGYGSGVEATRREYALRLSSDQIFALARSKREAEIWRLSIEHGLSWCKVELGWIKTARERLMTLKPDSRKR